MNITVRVKVVKVCVLDESGKPVLFDLSFELLTPYLEEFEQEVPHFKDGVSSTVVLNTWVSISVGVSIS